MGLGTTIEGTGSIYNLGGVQITNPTNGQTLVYDSVTELWVNSSGGGATGYQTIQGNGTGVAQETTINFIGSGVTVTDDPGNNRTNVTISSSGTSYYQTVQGQGSSATQEAILNFASDTFTVVDDPANFRTNVSVSGVISWSVVAANTGMTVQTGYINNSASLITFTLPAAANPGDTVRIVGYGTGLWQVNQNAGQTIRFGKYDTTTGTGGSIASTNQGDSVEVVCVAANTLFVVASATGNILIT